MESRLRFDLQFFAETAGERTEKATPKKRREARKKGQIAKSQELSTAFLLLGVFITLHLLSGRWAQEVGEFASDWFSHLAREDLSITGTVDLLTDAVLLAGQVLAPVFLAAVIIGVLINFLQVGAYFQPDLIKPKLDKLNPISGFKRIFSTRALVELVKSLLKLLIVGTVAFLTIRPALKPMLMLWAMEPAAAFSEVESTIFALTWRVGLVLVVLGIFDYVYQRWEYERSLRMTRQEVKDEYKETEGDPQIKSRLRQRARQLAMGRMMQAVPEADVVITNPTHIAVALKYEAKVMDAPVVVAMGQGYLAQRIKELAEENEIVIVENKPLARALFETAEVGEAIPADLYQAVAEVLAFVYRLKKRSI